MIVAMHSTGLSSFICITAAAAALIFALDLAGLDMALAHITADNSGFPLRQDWFLNTVMHSGAKYTAWGIEIFLCLMVLKPLGVLKTLTTHQRIHLATSPIVAVALISVVKSFSQTSCPWELQEFGGVATHLSHWRGWVVPDGGGGQCFPAGHASSGFAFMGGYFVLRATSPKIALLWLTCALAMGLVLGVCQQLRGAHFLSHTLWSGWLCWVSAWATNALFATPALAQYRSQ